MIFDSIESLHRYRGIHPTLDRAIALIPSLDLPALPVGRSDFGPGVFAMVSAYDTQPEASAFWEAHRLHADIQIVLGGRERIDWLPLTHTAVLKPYDEARELAELSPRPNAEALRLILQPGVFAIFFPADAHRPGIAPEAPGPVRKVVFKVRVTDGT